LDPEVKQAVIAELYFRIETTVENHTRQVIQIEDFLGRVGGIFGLIVWFFEIMFGGYIGFEARLRWIN